MPPKNIFVFNTVVAKLIFCQISRFNTFFVTKAYEVCLSRSDYNLRPQEPSSTILIRICLKTGNIVLYPLLLIVKHNSHPALFRAATLATLRA